MYLSIAGGPGWSITWNQLSSSVLSVFHHSVGSDSVVGFLSPKKSLIIDTQSHSISDISSKISSSPSPEQYRNFNTSLFFRQGLYSISFSIHNIYSTLKNFYWDLQSKLVEFIYWEQNVQLLSVAKVFLLQLISMSWFDFNSKFNCVRWKMNIHTLILIWLISIKWKVVASSLNLYCIRTIIELNRSCDTCIAVSFRAIGSFDCSNQWSRNFYSEKPPENLALSHQFSVLCIHEWGVVHWLRPTWLKFHLLCLLEQWSKMFPQMDRINSIDVTILKVTLSDFHLLKKNFLDSECSVHQYCTH